ncbi:MAG: hypothetical protein L3K09_02945 [Thermoplasmata archaeon]|nr:hypothetical protein [Thermoplasmata archaeon]
MTDLSETPAVPPTDYGGDERLGLFIAGGLLLLFGFGVAVILNLFLHLSAPSGGSVLGPWRITSTMGPYAWAILAFGLVTGIVGAALIALGRETAPGALVLPGYPY